MKKIFWLVESNGELSVTVNNIQQAQILIEEDFAIESDGGTYDIDDLQYTIIPKMMTQEEFDNLEEAN